MTKFTEIYFDDALRLAQFLSERFNEEIKPVEMDSEGFPLPSKHEEFGERTQALIVGDYAIAFFKKRTGVDEDRKHRNKNLNRVMFGISMKAARERANMSIEELSDYTDITPGNLRRLELGRYDASIDLIYNIAAALGCTFDFIEYKEQDYVKMS